MNRRIHNPALFILSKIESEDKANKVVLSFRHLMSYIKRTALPPILKSLRSLWALDAVFRKLELIG